MKLRVFLLCILFSQFLDAQTISLEDIWLNYKYYSPSSKEVSWYNNTHILQKNEKEVFAMDIFSGEQKSLFPLTVLLDSFKVSGFELSPLKNKIMFFCNTEKLYRRSQKSYVFIYDIHDQELLFSSKTKVFNPSFSFDEKMLAYTVDNNLFLADLKAGVETSVTKDGELNHIINGRTDWVYEEEFGFTRAHAWLKGNNKIAYLKFDESKVKTYDMQVWKTDLYPELYSYKYPKAGEDNSKVSLWIYDLVKQESSEVFSTNSTAEYIPKLLCSQNDSEVCFATNNRSQNHFKLLVHDVQTGEQKIIYEERSDKYVENPETILFQEGKLIIDSYKSGYHHFHEVDLVSGDVIDLTPRNYDVKDYLGKNGLSMIHYFTALYDHSHTKIICSSKAGKIKKLFKTDYWLEASFSPNNEYLLLEKSSLLEKPKSKYFKVSDEKEIKNWLGESSEKIKANVDFLEVESLEGHQIPAYVIYPSDFDKKKKYPLLMHCYGGPGYQLVTNKWNGFDFFYHQMIADKGCIVVLADGRGTDGNGTVFRQSTYGNMGKYEHQDQVTVVNYFKNKGYVNPDKVGIWGWSYGGYLSSLCLLKSPDVFSMAISVAPVTNWRYYDNIYTERYMGLPSGNAKGYDDNSPTNYAKNLKGKFLLIHGTGDDNVHLQNSIVLQNELLKYNKQFEVFFYPDKNHGIYGGTTRYNLYKKMTIFIEQNLLQNGN